jgi:hypothetical protein
MTILGSFRRSLSATPPPASLIERYALLRSHSLEYRTAAATAGMPILPKRPPGPLANADAVTDSGYSVASPYPRRCQLS